MKMRDFERQTLAALSGCILTPKELAERIGCTTRLAQCGLRLMESVGKVLSKDCKHKNGRRFELPPNTKVSRAHD